MTDFAEILRNSLENEDLLSLILSKPCKNCEVLGEKWTVRPVDLRGESHYQWAVRINGQEIHKNLPAEETLTKACELFGKAYLHGHIFTSQADHSLRINRKGKVHLTTSAPSKPGGKSQPAHNRAKQYLLPENEPCPFLTEIGVMTPAGKVKSDRYKKFRQINRFLELVNDIVPHLRASGVLNVVDFGCGKSYLTFALHHLLTEIHQREVRIVGLDRKTAVVRECQNIADRLHLKGLEFREGELWNHQQDRVDLAVSLHACDTATDEALAKAVSWRADVILAVPCCQHEIAAILPESFLPTIQQYGILKDRMSAILTDALRANALEQLGYKTQVVEFIDMEHTAKNLLIRAIRRPDVPPAKSADFGAYGELKSAIGIEQFHLDSALGQLQAEVK